MVARGHDTCENCVPLCAPPMKLVATQQGHTQQYYSQRGIE